MTGKQKRFCEEYVANRYNATQAYVAAYGVSPEVASKISYRVLKNQECRDYIAELEHDIFESNMINADRIANELASIAFADKQDLIYSPANKLKALDLLQKQINLQNKKIDLTTKNNITSEIGD